MKGDFYREGSLLVGNIKICTIRRISKENESKFTRSIFLFSGYSYSLAGGN